MRNWRRVFTVSSGYDEHKRTRNRARRYGLGAVASDSFSSRRLRRNMPAEMSAITSPTGIGSMNVIIMLNNGFWYITVNCFALAIPASISAWLLPLS